MPESLKTARDYIHWGAELFAQAGLVFGHGTDNALDEAASLVLFALDIDYEQPDAVLDNALEPGAGLRVRELLERRVSTGKPAAYLTHVGWFAGLPFYVDERVLVPRSPIAELIRAQFSPWIDPKRVLQVLDLATGCGCIGIACACAFPDARVDVSDVSADALDVVRENIKRHKLAGRVRALAADVFATLPVQAYDIIVSNPPYVPLAEVQRLPQEYRHEPAAGLAAGADGLDIVVRILAGAADYIAENGILVVEVGLSQAALVALFPRVPFLWLEFEHGGEGVFLLDAAQLQAYREEFRDVARRRPDPKTATMKVKP
jgi:ribosomal protein L3 glutamine methyltransferase